MKALALLFACCLPWLGRAATLTFIPTMDDTNSIDTNIVMFLTYTNEPPPLFTVGPYTTNHYSNLVAVLRILPLTNACPECGAPNHHELHVVNMEKWEAVQAQIVSHGQTSNPVIYRTAPVSEVVTQVVLRSHSQLHQRPVPPPLIMPTNAPSP